MKSRKALTNSVIAKIGSAKGLPPGQAKAHEPGRGLSGFRRITGTVGPWFSGWVGSVTKRRRTRRLSGPSQPARCQRLPYARERTPVHGMAGKGSRHAMEVREEKQFFRR